jgi:A/G-specific adenine glycosylase
VRGIVLREIRTADIPVIESELATLWPDAAQLDRAVHGLERDGLIVRVDGGYELP